MGRWMLAMISITLIKLTQTVEVEELKLCRRKTFLKGEELLCHDAATSLFSSMDIFGNKTHKVVCENCTLNTLDSLTFNVTKNSLSSLYLVSSQIYAIKQFAFSKFRMLRVLNLRNNTITDIDPKSFANLIRLAQIDLSYNNIRILINFMFEEAANLNWLNLKHNNIYYIQPHAFRGLSNLRHLYLSDNKLEKLEGFVFKHLPNLLLLYLENNNIVEIDSFAFANLKSVNSLYLNNNSIAFLTQYNFKPLISLNDLQLRNNNLTEIQISSFNGLTNLKHLYLGNNRLKTVKRYGFVGLDNLQTLELMNNQFAVFDLAFIENMKNLNMLWLEQNRIADLAIDPKLEPLNSLRSLGINDNNFTVLNYKLLYEKAPNVRDIFIFNNSWECDTLVNMFGFFQEVNVTLCASIDCSFNSAKELLESCSVEEDVEDVSEEVGDFVTGAALSPRITVALVISVKLLILL